MAPTEQLASNQKLLLRAALLLESAADSLYLSESLLGGRWPKTKQGQETKALHAEHRKLVRFLRRIAK